MLSVISIIHVLSPLYNPQMEVSAKKSKITITDVERKEIAGVEKFLHNLNIQMDNEVRVSNLHGVATPPHPTKLPLFQVMSQTIFSPSLQDLRSFWLSLSL